MRPTTILHAISIPEREDTESAGDSRNHIASGSRRQINEADPMGRFHIRDTTAPVLALSGSKEAKPAFSGSWPGMAHSMAKIQVDGVSEF